MSTAAAAPVSGVGADVVALGELDALVTRAWFRRYLLGPEELRAADRLGPGRRREYVAGRFAAKEAVLKALGLGLFRGVAPAQVEVVAGADGAPRVRLRGGLAARFPGVSIRVSISHKDDVAVAVAVTNTQEGPMSTSPTTAPGETPAPVAPPIARLRQRLGHEDAHYGGRLVDGARIMRMFGDLMTEVAIDTDGDEGLLSEYSSVRFLETVHPGDYIEACARLVRRTRLRRVVDLEARKVIAADPEGGVASGARRLGTPVLVATATATTVVPRRPVRERDRT